MSVLGLGAGGGINDEDDGLAGDGIDGADGAESVFGAVFVPSVFRSRGGDSMPVGLISSWSSIREKEGTASFGCVAVDFGVDSSCSTFPGSET